MVLLLHSLHLLTMQNQFNENIENIVYLAINFDFYAIILENDCALAFECFWFERCLDIEKLDELLATAYRKYRF